MKKAGFSLAELSIVLIIVGLLVGGVSAGSKLVHQSKLRAIVNEWRQIDIAVTSFREIYGALPGDFSSASSFWSGALNGNQDGEISPAADSAGTGSSEVGTAFKHLNLADLIKGDFVTGNILEDLPKMAFPSKYKGGVFILTSYTIANNAAKGRNHIAGLTENVVRLGRSVTEGLTRPNTTIGLGLLTVEDVQNIDTKLDDGIAISGNVSGHNEYGATTNVVGCLKYTGAALTDDDATAGVLTSTIVASYNLGTSFMCNISFNINF